MLPLLKIKGIVKKHIGNGWRFYNSIKLKHSGHNPLEETMLLQ